VPVSRAETLLKIKEAEAKAKEIVSQAEEKAKATSAAARKEAVRIAHEAEETGKASYDSAYAAEKAKVATEREAIVKKGLAEAEQLKVKAKANIPKADTYLLEQFERTVDASS
jgi:V/A-type H+-transporting ATPase subunit G/H